MLRNVFLLLGIAPFFVILELGFSSPQVQGSKKVNKCSYRIIDKSLRKIKTKKIVAFCSFDGCLKHAQKRGLCVIHGGGSTCSFDGCVKHAQNRGFCVAHGGGSLCPVDGCTKLKKKGGFCVAHGGGSRCSFDGCLKHPQKRGLCVAHGGRAHCSFDGCVKVPKKGGMCIAHGGGYRCSFDGCVKHAIKSGLCQAHKEGRDREERLLIAENKKPQTIADEHLNLTPDEYPGIKSSGCDATESNEICLIDGRYLDIEPGEYPEENLLDWLACDASEFDDLQFFDEGYQAVIHGESLGK